MSTADLHEAVFKWPHPEPSEVIVTGSFDGWSRTIYLSRAPNGFATMVKIPWGQKVSYKYIVDGKWTTTDTQPTELDPMGNINNVYNAPARPTQTKATASQAVLAPSVVAATPIKNEVAPASKPNGVLTTAKETAVGMAEAIAPTVEEPAPKAAPLAEEATAAASESTLDPTAGALKSVVSAASETTASAVTAAVSAVTAAINSVSGAVTKDEASAESHTETPATEPTKQAEPSPAEPEAGPEVALESVLPPSADREPVAPVVPVPVLPLTADPAPKPADEAPAKVTEVTAVEGATTSSDVPEISPQDASTHAPVIVNGEAQTTEPTVVALPPVTPSEIPAPAPVKITNDQDTAPAVNGATDPKASEIPAAPAVPTKEAPATLNGHKKHGLNFPTFGRHHRHSSSAHSRSEVSETGVSTGSLPSRSSSQRKQRKTSIIVKIKEFLHLDHHHHHEDTVQ